MNNNPLELVHQALERGAKAGCFGLAESHSLFSALHMIAERLNAQQAPQAASSDGPGPHPPGHPKDPDPKPDPEETT